MTLTRKRIFLTFLGLLIWSVPFSVFALVNINTAGKEELMTLAGIGEVKAQAIIDYRAHTPFAKKEDIQDVSGIGPATYAGIEAFITVSGGSSSEQEEDEEIEEEQTPEATESSSSSSKNSPSSITVRLRADDEVAAGAPVEFRGAVYDGSKEIRYANLEWNFGDGSTGKGSVISHTFEHAGRYVVVLRGYHSSLEAESRLTVQALSPDIRLTMESGGTLALSNRSSKEMDVGSWVLRDQSSSFKIPEDTFVLAGETIRFTPTRMGFQGSFSTELLFPDGKLAASAAAVIPAIASVPFTKASTQSYAAPLVLGTTSAERELPFSADEGEHDKDTSWVYTLGLAALMTFGVASTLYVQKMREEKPLSLADEFEIEETE